MLRLVLLCVVGVAVAEQSSSGSSSSTSGSTSTGTRSGSTPNQQNTRFFGGLVSGLASGISQLAGGNRPGGFGQGGFNQGGFNQGGFNQGGRPGGFGQQGSFFPGQGGGFPGQGGIFPGQGGGFPGQGGIFPGQGGGINVGIPGIGGVNINQGQGGIAITGRCNYCRTPWGYICCKQGTCPTPRPSCPPTRNFQPPQPCRGDGTCAGGDKCCQDTCLREYVCKQPIEVAFGG